MSEDLDQLKSSLQAQLKAMTDAVSAYTQSVVEPYVARTTANLGRCKGLLDLHDAIAPHAPAGGEAQIQDLLRAVVVFMHASLEDLLRTVAEVRLPSADGDASSNIPWAGTNGQAEKAALPLLAKHRGKSVDEVIRESVHEYLGRSSFNNTKDIVTLLGRLGLDAGRIQQHLSSLDGMIRRRHQIVHRADAQDASGKLASISAEQVQGWLTTTIAFTVTVISMVGVDAARIAFENPDPAV